MFKQFYFVFFLLFSTSSFAIDLAEIKEQPLSNNAIAIKAQVDAIAIHFLNEKEKAQVDIVLVDAIDKQTQQNKSFADALKRYRSGIRTDAGWEALQLNYASALSISQSKQKLLEKGSEALKDVVTGYGPDGVTQFKSELYLTKLNLEFFIYQEIITLHDFFNDLKISPVPVIVVLFKIILIWLGLRWWIKNSDRLICSVRDKLTDNGRERSFFIRVFWYFTRAHKSIAWLIAITLSFKIISKLPSLQHLVFLEIFTWWILGGAIAVSFILEFAYQNSRALSKALIRLRLSTINLYVWGFIVTGLVSQISAMTLGKATIYSWISDGIFFFYILLTIYSLHKWKVFIFEALNQYRDQPVLIKWGIKNKERLFFASLSTATCATWLFLQVLQTVAFNYLSEYQLFNHVLAYFFRAEVLKRTEAAKEIEKLEQIRGEETFSFVKPGTKNSALIDEYAIDEMTSLCQYLYSDSPAVCILSGERGVGTSTLLHRILHEVDNAEPIYLECPYDGYLPLLKMLGEKIGVQGEINEETVLETLRNSDCCYLIAFDSVQRLIKPRVGGLAHLMRLTNLMRDVRKSHRVVLAIDKSSWRFVDRARGDRLLFDLVEFMPRWNEKAMNDLLQTRIEEEGEFKLSFDGLALPRQWGKEEVSPEEHAKNGFFRILWDFSDGNPTVALRFFRRSLFINKDTNETQVRLFKAPSSEGLENMPKPMLAVLRSIVQLEIASPEELRACTQLKLDEVISTLRYFQSRGYIDWIDNTTRISDLWYRSITNILHRQHLLVK